MPPKNNLPKRIPLFDLTVSQAARKEAADTLASGWLTSGPKVRAFEAGVGKLLGVPQAVAVSSGTAGLHLALAARGGLAGREIVTTPYTFVGTVEAIISAGATPVFADIDPATLTIDPDEVDRKCSKKTAVILPVDIAGYPSDYIRLNKICDARQLMLLADAAHAIGSGYRRRSIPQLCDAAVFSFYSTKNLTCGEGGMVVSRHEELIEKIRLIARHGLTSATYERNRANKWEYDVTAFGYKANMPELLAAVGLGELTELKSKQTRRKAIAARYRANLKDLSDFVQLPVTQTGCRHGWHLYIVRLHLSPLRIGRNRFIREMASRGVECGVHYKPIYELSWYRERFKLGPRFFPNAEYAWQRAVTLPLYPGLSDDDVDLVCDAIRDIVTTFSR